MASNEVFETIRTVLAVRSYQAKPIPEETLGRIVEAARLTASSQNKQPWNFVVVQHAETLKQLGEWSSYGKYIGDAAAAILVVVKPGRGVDAARAIQSIVLQAWSEGVGSNWVGVPGLEPAKALLGIPDDLELFAVIPLGYPAEAIGKGIKNRKPLAEIAHREHWSEPFS
ncbi:MAG: nitroreductase family protein [Thermomicrobiales bacterium]